VPGGRFAHGRAVGYALTAAWFALRGRSANPERNPTNGATVASVCDVCGKGPGFGNNISHSHRRTRRRWNPNIQTVRAVVGGTHKRLSVCTSCIKAGKVSR